MKRIFTVVTAIAAVISAYAADFTEKELEVRAADGVRMGATLTAPEHPKAAVVLATGSGTQNRDEEVFGKKPFKTLAEFLSSHGYAVLRVDDRGFDRAEDAAKATVDTYTADVASALAVMDSIYPALPAGIIGHSAGGSYAIRNGAHNERTDFVITLAAPAWSGDSLVMSQSRALAVRLTGRYDNEGLQRRLLSIAKSDVADFIALAMITGEINAAAGEAAKIPEVQKQIHGQASALLSPWYRSMLRYDPADDIKAVKVPFLALNGSKDIQVLPGNLTTIGELNPAADTRLMESMNHLFQVCESGMIQEYATIPGDISDAALATILDWLEKRIAPIL